MLRCRNYFTGKRRLSISKEVEEVYDSSTRRAIMQKLLPVPQEEGYASIDEQILLQSVIKDYQIRGHLEAQIDPLYLSRKEKPEAYPPRTIIGGTKFPVNLQTKYVMPSNTFLGFGHTMTLKQIINLFKKKYCDKIGIEYMYEYDLTRRDWIKEEFELMEQVQEVTKASKVAALQKLIEMDILHRFVTERFPETEKYRIRGCESAIVALCALIDYGVSGEAQVENIIIGAHNYGRLEILAHVMEKPLRDVLCLMKADNEIGYYKYQLGTTASKVVNGHSCGINLVSHPGTPGVYYPLAVGKTAGIQRLNFQKNASKTLAIMFHPCAIFAAEGIIYEMMKQMLEPDYSVSGVIHIILNNQEMLTHPMDSITPEDGYCTDVAKSIRAPILHVNGDDIDAILNALQIALKYRNMFNRDIVVDVVGYFRYPDSFTPMSYIDVIRSQAVAKTPPVLEKYSKQLISENVINEDVINEFKEAYTQYMMASYKSSLGISSKWEFREKWVENSHEKRTEEENIKNYSMDPITGVDQDLLEDMTTRMWKIPKNVTLSYRELEMFKTKQEDMKDDKLDWINCEVIAFGSFINKGIPVRLCGLDVNKRKHVIWDSSSRPYNFLNHVFTVCEQYTICTTNDSLCATASFEAGMSMASNDYVIIWEAPETDKTGKIQPLIDFLADSSPVYSNQVNLILLIPHFLQRREVSKVSNGRPERVLDLCDEDEDNPIFDHTAQLAKCNMIVCFPSTPASYLHALRRHVLLPITRPLVIFMPSLSFEINYPIKELSKFEQILHPTKFAWYLNDPEERDDLAVEKLVLCTGRIYCNILEERKRQALSSLMVISRIEQLYPFPYAEVAADAKRYPNAKIYWVQEEPWSKGFNSYVEPRIEKATGKEVTFVGRPLRRDSDYSRLSRAELYDFLNVLFK